MSTLSKPKADSEDPFLEQAIRERENRRLAKYPRFRGEAAKIQDIRHSDEFILSGPYETGKTFAALWYLDTLLRAFPGSRAVILRKVRATMNGTVLETWRNVIAIRGEVQPYGGKKPEWYDYDNGSRVYIGGLDDPGKSLSGERDFIYVNQAEELELYDWETISSRATGRSAKAIVNGVPIAILFGDCNPSHPQHWILNRPKLRLLPTTHEDNPTLFDDNGQLTQRGIGSMTVLDAMTGVQLERGRFGKWVAAEGAIYGDFTAKIHKIKRFDIPSAWRIIAGVDWGYTNPGVIGIWALDGDGRAYLIHEVYRVQKDIDWWIAKAQLLQARYKPDTWFCDPSEPGFIKQFKGAGIPAQPGDNDVKPGIDEMIRRIKVVGDGRARLYIFEDALEEKDMIRVAKHMPCGFIEEAPNYVWKKNLQGKDKDEPLENQECHSLDEARYALYSIAPKDKPLIPNGVQTTKVGYKRPKAA